MYRNVYMQDTSEIYTENEESNDRRFIGLVNMSTSISYAYIYIYIGLRYRCYFIIAEANNRFRDKSLYYRGRGGAWHVLFLCDTVFI